MNGRLPIPITSDHGILKQLLDQGDPTKLFPSYKKGSTVSISYKAYNIPFNSSIDQTDIFKHGTALVSLQKSHQEEDCTHSIGVTKRCKIGESSIEIKIGYGFAFEGLEIAVKTMRIGEKSEFIMQPKYAEAFIQFESTIRKHKNGSNNLGCCAAYVSTDDEELFKLFGCAIEMEITVNSVVEADVAKKEFWQMSIEEKLAEIKRLKVEGDKCYKVGKYQKAPEFYSHAIGHCIKLKSSLSIEEGLINLKPEVEDIEYLCKLNYSACKLKLEDYTEVINICTELLKLKDNIKARFRRGQAYLRRGDLNQAQVDFDMLKGKADIHDLVQEYSLLDLKIKDSALKERSLFKNIFY